MSENSTETTTAKPADVRAWAIAQGLSVGKRGTLSAEVKQAYADAHSA